jgi:hypothetical protein
MAAMSELVARRLLRDVDGRLEFVNELVRARLYLKIPSAARTRMHDGVATRLLVAEAVGESIPGLEIAWHCIRARRHEQATPFLMSGARQAILHGAPDEAARALSSALGQLKGRTKDEAALVLAEAYQEMAEWRAALECIRELDPAHRQDRRLREVAKTLEIESLGQLGHFAPNDVPSVLDNALATALGSTDTSTSVRAILSAATLAGCLQSREVLESVGHFIDNLTWTGVAGRERGRLLLARAITHYHSREFESARHRILEGIEWLKEAGATDTTFVQLHTGLGALACAEGRYTDAIEALAAAYSGAERLDHNDLMSRVASNLATCQYRIGCEKEHLRWATVAWEKSKSVLKAGYDRVQPAYHYSLATLSAGHIELSRTAIEELRSAGKATKFHWTRQAALLLEADLVWLLGERSHALRIIADVWKEWTKPLGSGWEGPFTRWCTLYLVREGRYSEVEELLASMELRLSFIDALDRAEILCSRFHVGTSLGQKHAEISRRARESLEKLPLACTNQLKHLGLLLPN